MFDSELWGAPYYQLYKKCSEIFTQTAKFHKVILASYCKNGHSSSGGVTFAISHELYGKGNHRAQNLLRIQWSVSSFQCALSSRGHQGSSRTTTTPKAYHVVRRIFCTYHIWQSLSTVCVITTTSGPHRNHSATSDTAN